MRFNWKMLVHKSFQYPRNGTVLHWRDTEMDNLVPIQPSKFGI